MLSEWRETKLQDIVSILGDGLHGTPKYTDNGEYCFINGNNLSNGKIIFKDTTKRISHEEYLKYKKNLNDRTVFVSINGTIGNVAFYNNEKVMLGKSACYFNVIDSVDKRFVRYVMATDYFFKYLHNYATGTTIQNVSLKSMREFPFQLPPLPEQKAIAHILGSLDDKIELNRKMNETLEAMAQAMFKSWFIDFDPVLDNAILAGNPIPEELAGRAEIRRAILEKKQNAECSMLNAQLKENKTHTFPNSSFSTHNSSLFPSEFIHTEKLGWIPKGWEVEAVSKFGQIVCGKTPPKKNPEFYGDEIPFIKIPDMHNQVFAIKTTEYLSSDGAQYQIKKQIPKGSICVSCIATVGKVVIASQDSHTNQQINSIVPLRQEFSSYLYFYMLELCSHLHILASGGSATLNLNTGNFSKIQILKPDNSILELFDSKVKMNFEKILNLSHENKTLSKLRDTLLPKLLSGELRIKDAEKLVEETL